MSVCTCDEQNWCGSQAGWVLLHSDEKPQILEGKLCEDTALTVWFCLLHGEPANCWYLGRRMSGDRMKSVKSCGFIGSKAFQSYGFSDSGLFLFYFWWWWFCSVAKLCSTLQPHGLQHARPPCPTLSPGICPSSCPLSWWCHPTISTVSPHTISGGI